MKIVELHKGDVSDEILDLARRETIILRNARKESFVLAPVDDFALEVELLRHNSQFMAYLDELASQKAIISLEEVENELGL